MDKTLALLVPILLLFVGIYIYEYFQNREALGHDFNWYTDNYKVFIKDGRVVCFVCKGAEVSTQRAIGPGRITRHICKQCGQTLFYSQEPRRAAGAGLGSSGMSGPRRG
jgi:hypothetical protein